MNDRDGRSRTRRRFGIAGAVLGLAAAGVAAGVAAERMLVRRARNGGPDPYAGERFGQLPYDETLTVSTPDGVELYVEIVEPSDGIALDGGFAAELGMPPGPVTDPTVVFVPGFCLDLGTFHFQRKDLTRRGEVRAVFYDQPGHGRSGRKPSGEYELSALGDALRAVVEETTPDGPVVLVGHSMGAMTILALAQRHPAFVADRVAGVLLIAPAAGRLDGNGGSTAGGLVDLLSRFGRPLGPLVGGATRLTGGMIDRARRASGDLAWLLTRRYGFGLPHPSPAVVSYVEQMNTATPAETVARYLKTLQQFASQPAGEAALGALRGMPVRLVTGDRDPVTPLSHAEQLQARLGDAAELVVVEEGGHVVLLEHPDAVNEVLSELLEKVG